MDIISNSMMNSGVQQRTPTKRSSKPKKKNNNNIKPIKVVYISNPMKVKTSASEFMALVQELTGQNAESPPDPSRFQEPGSDDGGGDGGSGGGHKMNSDDCLIKIGHHDQNDHARVVPPPVVDPNNNCQGQLASGGSSMESSFEPYDDVFTPQMIENISAMMPESVFYDSPQVDEVLMQCNNYIHQ